MTIALKKNAKNPGTFPGGISRERNKLRTLHRVTIKELLRSFQNAVEARAINEFWESRKAGKLKPDPEKLAQAFLALFAKGALNTKGLVFRELFSGIGFVDIGIIISRILHIIELKIVRKAVTGSHQLQEYMLKENCKKAWLVLIDARASDKKRPIPPYIHTSGGIIRTVVVDINPVVPSHTD